MPSRRTFILAVFTAVLCSGEKSRRYLFLGDSITSGFWTGTDQEGWVYRAVAASNGAIKLAHNSGVAGNTTSAMLSRLDTDVWPYNPDVVVIMGGTNDFNQGVAQSTVSNLAAIVLAVKERHITPILCTIMPTPDAYLRSKQAPLNEAIRTMAKAHNVELFDANSVVATPDDAWASPAYSDDGTHPNAVGSELVGRAFAVQFAREAPPPKLPPIKKR